MAVQDLAIGAAPRKENFTSEDKANAGTAMAPSISLARSVTVACVNVFQPDERIQHWVPGH
jgi:hypothetical protein